MIFFGAVYLVAGLAFGELAGWSTSHQMRGFWRLSAWVVSTVAFAAHIGYERLRLGNSSRATAAHAAIAAALGAFGLAAAANVHEWVAVVGYRRSIKLALLVWPLITLIPAFVVAWVAAAVLNRRQSGGSHD